MLNPFELIPTFILNKHYHVLFETPLPSCLTDRISVARRRLKEMLNHETIFFSPVYERNVLNSSNYSARNIQISKIIKYWPDRVLHEFLHILHHDFLTVAHDGEISADYDKFKVLLQTHVNNL